MRIYFSWLEIFHGRFYLWNEEKFQCTPIVDRHIYEYDIDTKNVEQSRKWLILSCGGKKETPYMIPLIELPMLSSQRNTVNFHFYSPASSIDGGGGSVCVEISTISVCLSATINTKSPSMAFLFLAKNNYYYAFATVATLPYFIGISLQHSLSVHYTKRTLLCRESFVFVTFMCNVCKCWFHRTNLYDDMSPNSATVSECCEHTIASYQKYSNITFIPTPFERLMHRHTDASIHRLTPTDSHSQIFVLINR